ncbi:unnamed protein product [Gadus morhua 'NCC']
MDNQPLLCRAVSGTLYHLTAPSPLYLHRSAGRPSSSTTHADNLPAKPAVEAQKLRQRYEEILALVKQRGHSSREHQPNDLLNETKQEGVREHPDLEQEHIENLNDLVPDVTPPDICNYDFNETHREQTTDSDTVTFSDLKPGLKYDFQIKTQLKSGGLSQPALTSAHTDAVPPGNVQVSHVSSSTVSLTWETPAGEVEGYVVTCFYDSEAHREQTTDSDTVTFADLKPGLKYDFQIKTQLKSGGLSQPALTSAHTEAIPPGNVQVSHVSSSTVSLTWEPPAGSG